MGPTTRPRRGCDELATHTSSASNPSDRDVRVLSIQRGSLAIPSPRGETALLARGVVLCLGELNALRELVPRASSRQTA